MSAATADDLPAGVLVCDALGTVTTANAVAGALLGRSRPILIGGGFLDLGWVAVDAEGDARAPADHPLAVALRTRAQTPPTMTAVGDETHRYLLASAGPLTDGGAVCTFVDCTALFESTLELRSGRRLLARALQARSDEARTARERLAAVHETADDPRAPSDPEPPSVLPVSDLVAAVQKLLRPAAGDLDLRFDLEPDTPHVRAAAGELAQLLLRLVLHARGASGGAPVTVRSGQGVSQDVPVVLLDVETRGGFGATLRLPRAEVDRAPAAPGEPPAGDGCVVLVVEDTEAVRRLIATVLGGRGYRVVEAQNGHAALDVLERGGVDLVLTDMVMPRMTGAELVGLMAERWPALPVVVMSGYTESSVGTLAGTQVQFLPKPFSMTALLEAVAAALAPRS